MSGGDDVIRQLDGGRFQIDLTVEEAEMLLRLLGELRALITNDLSDQSGEPSELIGRLFPPASTSDDEADAEYHRLMRSELVTSKLAAFSAIEATLGKGGDGQLDETGMVAFMQSVNSIRLVLGTMLQVSDDPNAPEVAPGFEDSREYHLYGYLSWLLESAVSVL